MQNDLITPQNDPTLKGFGGVLMRFVAALSLVAGVITLIFFWAKISDSYNVVGEGQLPDLAGTGQIGDFVGGVVGTLFSLTGVFLLYITLKSQRESFNIERFETRVFEMIKIHRDNVAEMKYSTTTKKKEKKISEGRKVFKIIDNDFQVLYSELSFFFNANKIEEIYEPEYLAKIELNPNLSAKVNLHLYAQIDITYSILFLGLSSQDRKALISLFKSRYKADFCTKVIAYAALKPKEANDYYSIWEDAHKESAKAKFLLLDFPESYKKFDATTVLEKGNLNSLFEEVMKKQPLKNTIAINFGYEKYYGGHQFRLGHYFRHLFQTVNFINNNTDLNFKSKYDHVKLLRTQLSTFEQRVIFINSISVFGRIWELEVVGNPTLEINKNNCLITKFNFIRNIPHGEIVDKTFSISDFYPGVTLETSYDKNDVAERYELERQYN